MPFKCDGCIQACITANIVWTYTEVWFWACSDIILRLFVNCHNSQYLKYVWHYNSECVMGICKKNLQNQSNISVKQCDVTIVTSWRNVTGHQLMILFRTNMSFEILRILNMFRYYYESILNSYNSEHVRISFWVYFKLSLFWEHVQISFCVYFKLS